MPRVETVQLDFRSLADLHDERIAKLLRLHLQKIAQDCMDRPGDPAKRKVTLEFIAEPVLDEHGQCETVKLEIECKSKVPTFRSKKFEMRVTKAGFLFNKDFPDDIDQPALFPGDEKDGGDA